MPCYQERKITTEISVSDPQILRAGLKKAGFELRETSVGLFVRDPNKYQEATIDARGRIVYSEGDKVMVNRIKRAYAQEVVATTAKRFGWQLAPVKNEPHKVELKRKF